MSVLVAEGELSYATCMIPATSHHSSPPTTSLFLLLSSPALVGTLWDVTDADIDRYCHTLLKSWLSRPGASLPSAAAQSRGSCRLTTLNGAAVVLYGVPATTC